MVIFKDLRKLLLSQKLNLGFDCQLCRRKFYNRIDHLEHSRSCCNVPDLKCPKCGKTFGHVRILQLHLQFHNMSESLALQSPEVQPVQSQRMTDDTTPSSAKKNDSDDTSMKETDNGDNKNALTTIQTVFDESSVGVSSKEGINEDLYSLHTPKSFKILETSLPKRSSHKTRDKPKQAKKKVGLTKIKMEDCLRCDACSCIYIDEKDYYKHMRNFHQRDVNNAPIKQQKAKRKCQSCCKQCRGSHCTPTKQPRATHQASNLIFRFNMKDNIKNRWTQMVSQQMNGLVPNSTLVPHEPELINIKPDPDANITIKQEPDPDLSYLLSQVEVKIKTEPPDDY